MSAVERLAAAMHAFDCDDRTLRGVAWPDLEQAERDAGRSVTVGMDQSIHRAQAEYLLAADPVLAAAIELGLRLAARVTPQQLAEVYNQSSDDSVFVAKLCDEYLDRSGALLGQVRDIAYRLRVPA